MGAKYAAELCEFACRMVKWPGRSDSWSKLALATGLRPGEQEDVQDKNGGARSMRTQQTKIRMLKRGGDTRLGIGRCPGLRRRRHVGPFGQQREGAAELAQPPRQSGSAALLGPDRINTGNVKKLKVAFTWAMGGKRRAVARTSSSGPSRDWKARRSPRTGSCTSPRAGVS